MGTYVLCPYFKRERKKSITCEDTIRSYPTLREKRECLKVYCTSEWKRCPYASALDSIYSMDIPDNLLKEIIMEHTIEEMKKEINKLMRENGQLRKKNDVLKEQIADRDRVAEKNHEMYMKSLKTKESLLKAKDENIKWLESFASAFLVVAYGEDIREIRMTKDKVLKLMTEYSLTCKLDEETGDWLFLVDHWKGEKPCTNVSTAGAEQ